MPETDVVPDVIPDSPATAAALEALDRFAPLPKPKDAAPAAAEPAAVEPLSYAPEELGEKPPPTPEAKPEAKPEPPKPKAEKKSEPQKRILPSFLDQKPAAAEPAAPAAVEFPEELPGVKDQKTQSNWKRFKAEADRRAVETEGLRKELTELRGKVPAPEVLGEVEKLKKDNADLLAYVERYSLQNHPGFQAQVDLPLQRARDMARKIFQDAGGDPAQLDNVFNARSGQRWSALDEVSVGIPESAKTVLGATMKDIWLLEENRQAILSDPKRNLENLRRQDLQNERARIDQQSKHIQGIVEDTLKELRENKDLMVLQRSANPSDKWWNDQAEQIEATTRNIMQSPDPKLLSRAVALGASADVVLGLFHAEHERANKLEAENRSLRGKEPSMDGDVDDERRVSLEDEIKRPFAQVFIEQLQRQRNRQ